MSRKGTGKCMQWHVHVWSVSPCGLVFHLDREAGDISVNSSGVQ